MSILYINHLHPQITEAMLYEKFSTAGPVDMVNIGRDMETKKPIGYAHVHFREAKDAKRAYREMNLDVLHGRPLDIKWPDEGFQLSQDDSVASSNKIDASEKSTKLSESSDSQPDSISDGGDPDDPRATPDLGASGPGKESPSRSSTRSSRNSDNSETSGFTNLFIKNFGNDLDDDDLYDLLRRYGKIVCCTIAKYENGQSKGHGYCNFRTPEAAAEAVKGLNGHMLNGRKLYVGPFVGRGERKAPQPRARPQYQPKTRHDWNLYIKNLDPSINDEKLKDEFAKFGRIKSSTVRVDNAGRSKGIGFVAFETEEEAKEAIKEMDGAKLGNMRIDVTFALNKQEQ